MIHRSDYETEFDYWKAHAIQWARADADEGVYNNTFEQDAKDGHVDPGLTEEENQLLIEIYKQAHMEAW